VEKQKEKRKVYPTQIAMRITEGRREKIKILASALHPIIPASTRNNSYSLQKIAKETRTKDFYKLQSNKQLTLEHYLVGVFRKYPRKPKIIVIKIVKEAAIWMANKHRELTPEMKGSIADAMAELGFSVRTELMNIEQPEFDKISIPSDDLGHFYNRLELHPLLTEDVKILFMQGHANDAVRRATELFEKFVKDNSNSPKLFGTNLMEHAFNENAPILKVNKFENDSDKKEQKGFKYLTMGVMGCIRNKFSHDDAEQIDFLEAFKLLCFISYLLEVAGKNYCDS